MHELPPLLNSCMCGYIYFGGGDWGGCQPGHTRIAQLNFHFYEPSGYLCRGGPLDQCHRAAGVPKTWSAVKMPSFYPKAPPPPNTSALSLYYRRDAP